MIHMPITTDLLISFYGIHDDDELLNVSMLFAIKGKEKYLCCSVNYKTTYLGDDPLFHFLQVRLAKRNYETYNDVIHS